MIKMQNVMEILRALVGCVDWSYSMLFKYIYFYVCGHFVHEEIRCQFVGITNNNDTTSIRFSVTSVIGPPI
jgi:hypothetical protein